MWDETLIESRNGKRKNWFTLPLSFFAHALVVFVLIGASYWSIGAVPAPVTHSIGIFFTQSDDLGGGSMVRAERPRHSATTAPIVSNNVPPVTIPVPMQSNLDWH